MNDLYHSLRGAYKDEKVSAARALRRLRILLIVWIVSFLFTVIWFSFFPGN